MEAVLERLGLSGASEGEVAEALREGSRLKGVGEAELLGLVEAAEAAEPESHPSLLLQRLLALLPDQFLFRPDARLLQRCLSSSKDHVLSPALSEIICRDGVTLSPALLLSLVTLLPAHEGTAPKRALLKLSPKGADVLENAAVLAKLEEGLKGSSTQRFRIHEWIVEGCVGSEEFQARAAKAGLVTRQEEELNCEDVLSQLNALELMGGLAAGSAHFARLLHSMGLPGKLEGMLKTAAESPDTGSFLFPAILRFFGHLAREEPGAALAAFPVFARSLWTSVLNATQLDTTQRLLGLDTLALLGSTLKGRRDLAPLKEMRPAMRSFAEAVSGSGSVEVRKRHMEALRDLVKPLEGETEKDSELVRAWWEACLPWATLLELFKQPVREMRLGAGELVEVLAGRAWGRAGLLGTAGFLEFLLDRSSEHTMEGRHLRFAIVNAFLTDTAQKELHAPTLAKLKDFRSKGVYYVTAPTEIAMEAAQ